MTTKTMTETSLTDLAAEADIDLTVARLRMEGWTHDHIGNQTPLSEGEVSLIRACLG